MRKILVIGSINEDLVFSVKQFPQVGETIKSISHKTYIGGKGANQAFALSKMNVNVSFFGLVGDDSFGKNVINKFKEHKVNTDNIEILEGVTTGKANIIVDENANNQIILSPESNSKFGENQLNKLKKIIKDFDIVLMQLEINFDFIIEAIKVIKNNNKIIILNPGPAIELTNDLINMCDLIIPNEIELFKIFGESCPEGDLLESVKSFVKLKQKQNHVDFLVTLGSIGSVYISKNKVHFEPAKLVKAIDTTAAGDTFIGAYISKWSNKCSIEESMIFATKAAAIAVSRKGALDSIPNYDEIK